MANFYCKNCGAKSGSIKNLMNGFCNKNQETSNNGKHVLYEGSEKSQYSCKYCGSTSGTILNLTNGFCQKHPNGPNKGKHSPAL